jgi:hypothetical protein
MAPASMILVLIASVLSRLYSHLPFTPWVDVGWLPYVTSTEPAKR